MTQRGRDDSASHLAGLQEHRGRQDTGQRVRGRRSSQKDARTTPNEVSERGGTAGGVRRARGRTDPGPTSDGIRTWGFVATELGGEGGGELNTITFYHYTCDATYLSIKIILGVIAIITVNLAKALAVATKQRSCLKHEQIDILQRASRRKSQQQQERQQE